MGTEMITIDGSLGEGGGQVLRTSLSLSLITGQGFTINGIRAGRKSPGLKRQHLTGVQAAAQIGGATLSNAKLNSQTLTFVPRKISSGEYSFAVGTAGNCTLILQTLLPALLLADKPSVVTLEGGTHNPYAPPFDYLQKVFATQLAKMGAKVDLRLEKYGFYPAGGGRFVCKISPCEKLLPLALVERGEIINISATALVAQISEKIGWRELKEITQMLHIDKHNLTVENIADSIGPGNLVFVEAESEGITEIFTSFGQIGVRAETVGRRAARQAKAYLDAKVPVGEYLPDQLLLPMALGSGGQFRTMPLTQHTLTNIEVIKKFLPVKIKTENADDDNVIVEVIK